MAYAGVYCITMVEANRLVGSTDEHVRYNGKTETTIYRPSIHRADVYQSRWKAGNSLKMTNRQRYLFDLQEILVVESINGN